MKSGYKNYLMSIIDINTDLRIGDILELKVNDLISTDYKSYKKTLIVQTPFTKCLFYKYQFGFYKLSSKT